MSAIKIMYSAICFIVLVIGGLCLSWTHSIVLDKDSKYVVYWTVYNDTIMFKVEVEAKGYVGFGLSKNGAMSGSDMFTGWVTNGRVYHQDRHALGNYLPPMDEIDDWQVLSGSENETHTSLQFKRKLNTCDDQDIPIDESTIRLIYAFSDEDPPSPDLLAYHHSNRGSRSTRLLQPKLQDKTLHESEEIHYWDILSPNFNLSKEHDSIYWCKLHKTPNITEKNHIIKIEPVIVPGHESYVHHIVLYECLVPHSQITPALDALVDQGGHECRHPNMPELARLCEAIVIAAWAVGGEAIILPKEVGIPLDENTQKYFSLEMHYDNQMGHGDISDTSGLRLYYTPNTRKYDAGVLMIGSNANSMVLIPPRQKDYVVVGHADPNCFQTTIPPEGIKFLGLLLHAHLLGRKIKARHFRNGVELKPLGNDENYDFNYQEYVMYEKEVTIFPGDHISVECTYNSQHRSTATLGGFATTDEMCLIFALYYPVIPRYAALSTPMLWRIKEIIGFNKEVTRNEYEEEVLKMDWKKVNLNDLQNVTRYSSHVGYCISTDGITPMNQTVSYPEIVKPYASLDICSHKQISQKQVPVEQVPVMQGHAIHLRCFNLSIFLSIIIPLLNSHLCKNTIFTIFEQ